MKNRSLFKFSLLFLFPFVLFGANSNKMIKHEKEKIIKKEFEVNRNATLKVENSYGNLNVITWDQNRIVIEVHITTSGKDEDDVQQKLDAITVDFKASPNLVSAETIFGKKNSWWDELFQNNSVNMEINYLIKMPITNQVNLENDYGNIRLDELKGRAIISCDYGRITTKALWAENNVLDFDYSDNCYFEYIKSGKIEADYSGFTVGKTNSLTISADYSDSTIEIAEEVTFECDYGSLEVEKVNSIVGEGDYLTMRFGEVYKNISLDASYGSIHVDRMMENAGDIHIDGGYTGIEIGIAPSYNFQFTINLDYASLDAPNKFNFSQQIQDTGDNYYEGYYGNAHSENTIEIESDYGSVQFYLN